jgi:hypothetical protein
MSSISNLEPRCAEVVAQNISFRPDPFLRDPDCAMDRSIRVSDDLSGNGNFAGGSKFHALK